MWNPDKNEKSKEDRIRALFEKEAKEERIAIQQEPCVGPIKEEKYDFVVTCTGYIPPEAKALLAKFKKELFLKD